PGDGRGPGPGDVDASVLRTHVFDAADLRRALTRIAHEIVERNHGADEVVLVGLYTRGVTLAHRIAAAIASFEEVEPAVGVLDVAFYRDDIGLRPVAPLGPTEVPSISGKVVVLVDDVLFTGRTARAAPVARHRAGCGERACIGNDRTALVARVWFTGLQGRHRQLLRRDLTGSPSRSERG
ncbi:MAG: pyrimidine operon attenuation protein / uracil phosphoribosyltransferase, partial [Actinomycetota bacterium]|nr:pyrimidine operon attenuation protein / uracil phosphoribosyltransferase [Actinomycetota bacterium]